MKSIALATIVYLLPLVSAYNNYSSTTQSLNRQYFSALDDRPKDCPPCFNCLLPAFECTQFADCQSFDGRCDCPSGFGTDDCSQPLCGALSDGKSRPVRDGKECQCKDGWTGINCNLCTNDDACTPLMPKDPEGNHVEGVCYKGGLVVKENYQMCDVTNRKILDILKGQIPQVTFTCNENDKACNFQFWVDQQESFFCKLDHCKFELEAKAKSNDTHYNCENIQCSCIPGRMLCGAKGSIDLTDFLRESIAGPGSFSCRSGGSGPDDCKFSEPAMNDLIGSVFADPMITLKCNSGECLARTQVPGWQRPENHINGAAIAAAIAGSLILVIALILIVVYLHRRSNMKAGLGPIHLPLNDDDESSKLITEHKPASLHFKDVSYVVNGKVILSGVHGAVNPGQVMAIMGASGAGKTTFLDILARKNKRGTVTGQILVNGYKATDEQYREVIGFVDQDDTMMPTLTVYETILNSALLRLPRDMDYNSKSRRVLEVMQQLGILHIKDQLVGAPDGVRGISGGEKRRVSIACELVTSPAILFLDEPTSGLDSFNAYNVVECLVSLAQNYNRTIVFTIHQPRSNIVALFDRLVLLAKGRMVYSGEYKSCQDYFAGLGYPCPPGFNIADFLVDLTVHAEAQSVATASTGNDSDESSSTAVAQSRTGRRRGDSVRDRQERALFTRKASYMSTASHPEENAAVNPQSEWAGEVQHELQRQRHDDEDAATPPAVLSPGHTELDVLISSYLNSATSQAIHNEIEAASSLNNNEGNGNLENVIGTGPLKGFKRIGWWSQFSILSSRTWKNLYRNPMLMLTHHLIAIVIAILCGVLFYHVTHNIEGFQNRMGLFFFVLALFGFSTLSSLTVFSQERLLFLRERANGYYSPITYFCAKVFFDLIPLRILPPILLGAIVYPMVGLLAEWPAFFKFLLVLLLFNFSAATICLFIGIVFRDNGLANLVGSLVMLFSLLTAGLLLNHNSFPAAAAWMQTISIFHYGFEALIVNEVSFLTLVDHKYGLDIEVPGATILTVFGFNSQAYWKDVSGLAIFSGSFLVLAYIAMHLFLVERR